MDLKSEYNRISKNYDRCLKALADIIVFCKAKKDFVIAGIIEDCLNELDVPKQQTCQDCTYCYQEVTDNERVYWCFSLTNNSRIKDINSTCKKFKRKS